MKKIFFYIAAIALTISCSDMDEEFDITSQTAATAETTFVTLNLNLEESPTTRISVTTGETDDDDWVTAWEDNDAVIVYSIDNSAYKVLYYDSATESFSGEVYTGDNRIIHYDDSSWLSTSIYNDIYYIGLCCDSYSFSYGGTPTVISEEVINIEEETVSLDVAMQHVGAAMDLRMSFENIPTEISLTLTGVTIGGTPSDGDDSDYTWIPYYTYADPSKDVDDDDFSYRTYTGSKTYTTPYIDIEADTDYSIQLGVLPFTLESGKNLNVTLVFNDGAINRSFDVPNNTGSDFDFARGTYSYIDMTYDLENFTKDLWISQATAFSDTTSAGTEADPIEISTAGELAYLSLIAGGFVSDATTYDVYYKLTSDIDLDGYGWFPIGGVSAPFCGYFDGGDHTIKNLTIDSGGDSYQGLFGYIYYASISNVNLVDANICGATYTGGIVGYSSYSTIINCSNTGENASITTEDSSYCGGITGHLFSSTVSKCYNSCDVSGLYSRMGGISGCAYSSSVVECYNTGDIKSSSNSAIAGIVGYSYITSVTACYNTGSIAGSWGVAGIVGCNSDSTVITACYNVGAYNPTGSNYDSIGAIFGYEYNSTIYTVATECYYLVTSTTTNAYGESVASVAALNAKVTDMNTAANTALETTGIAYFIAGAESDILPSLLGETITYEYKDPSENIEDFSPNGGITGTDYNE